MPSRNINVILIALCVAVLCYFTHRRTRTALIVGDALELINHYYVDPVDDDDLLTAAMNGMTSTLDEHSEYIPIDAYEAFQDSISQEFAGIGIYVEQQQPGQPIRVITPLVGSPALKAGMLPGDLIVEVDNEDVSAMELKDVSDRLKGPIDTIVHLVVRRGSQQIAMRVKRATIPLPSVIGDHRDSQDRWVYRLADDPSIAYIQLTSFGEKTVDELTDVLDQLDNDYRGLVLDLRGNGGGLLQAAADVSDMFLDKGKIVSTRIRGGKQEDDFHAGPGTLVDPGKPLAILVNGDSASASEIVAACLQDNRRAAVVGKRTYGKGTVQNILPLHYGRSALRLTVARYYRPSGENIHRSPEASEEDPWGVRPDSTMEVEMDPETMPQVEQRRREASYPAMALVPDQSDLDPLSDQNTVEIGAINADASMLDLDPQLRRAVEYLREQVEQNSPERQAA